MNERLVFTGVARRIVGWLAGLVGIALLLASAVWWYGESVWGRYQVLTPAQAFADGDFGLQVAPLKYLLVAQTVSQAALGDKWVQRFGFLAREHAASGMCEKDAPGNLPVGFSVSNRLQGSATPVPVKFVGLTCAACHSASVNNHVVIGAGSQTADVIAFTDAYSNAILDPTLTADTILDQYAKQCPGDEGTITRAVDGFFIGQWLSGLRAQLRDNATKYDVPFHGAQLAMPTDIPTGPSRTRPFRSVVRNTLNFPGQGNVAYSKVPLAAMQGLKQWSQYDGSIGDPVVRSLIAVFTSGSTIPALNEKQIADNVKLAADYTLLLGVDPKLPKLADSFPDAPKPSADTLTKGRAVYMAQCDICHGHPEGTSWQMPAGRPNPSITKLAEIGTDPGRLDFRYADMLAAALGAIFPNQDTTSQNDALVAKAKDATASGDLATADWWNQASAMLQVTSREFPAGHRRAFPGSELAKRDGYENAPIPFAYLRSPYLHNGSVPTMRELIGLDPRPAQFCRGNAGYDAAAQGVAAPAPGPTGCTGAAYFLFDTSLPGNSNQGHSYPKPGTVSHDDLEALLAYVGTL